MVKDEKYGKKLWWVPHLHPHPHMVFKQDLQRILNFQAGWKVVKQDSDTTECSLCKPIVFD
jgi:hypothetical protein